MGRPVRGRSGDAQALIADCPSLEALESFHRGETPASEADQVRAHLDSCAKCRDRTLGIQEDISLLDDIRLAVQRNRSQIKSPTLGGRLDRGTRVGSYEIEELLGAGGMSRVYRAKHIDTDQLVALKLLREEHLASAEGRARFDREAKTMTTLKHPYILTVHDCIQDHGRIALVMELLPGRSLREWIASQREEKRTPDPVRIVEVTIQAAKGIGLAHRAGLVHRDIKPSNLLLDEEDNVKVSDFGVVQALESTTWVTGTGRQIGTPAYMSPEQCKGERANPASDVYSLGVTLFELATGRLPFEVDGGSPLAQMLRHISDTPPDPVRFNHKLSDRLASIILRCLEKDPQHRFDNGQLLADELEALARDHAEQAEPAEARKTGWTINLQSVRQQIENLPQRSIVAWACRLARRVESLNSDSRVRRALELAEASVGCSGGDDQPTSTRILAHMQGLRAASLAAAEADGDASEASVASARAAAAASSAAAARCTADAAADAVFALQNAFTACRRGKLPVTTFWRETQKDYRRLNEARLGAPGTIGHPLPEGFWEASGPHATAGD